MSLSAWLTLFIIMLVMPLILFQAAVMPALEQLKYTYQNADAIAQKIAEQ